MKKHLLGAVLLSGLVLFGCESNEKPVSNGESVANESVAEQKELTATEIESYILSQLPDKYDWSCGYSEKSNLIIFVYKGFYLDLMDAQKYLDASKFQTDWYAKTNQMIRFNKRMEKELRAMGYDGEVATMVEDSYKETMFMVTTGEDYEWVDLVLNVKGNGER